MRYAKPDEFIKGLRIIFLWFLIACFTLLLLEGDLGFTSNNYDIISGVALFFMFMTSIAIIIDSLVRFFSREVYYIEQKNNS